MLVMRGEITASSIYEVLPFRTRARPAPQPMRRKRGHQQTRAPRYDYVNILCVVASSGIATFYESGGAVVAELDLEQKNVKTLAFDGGDQPLLATANDDGVRLHNLTLWRGRGSLPVEGRATSTTTRRRSTIPEPSTRTASAWVWSSARGRPGAFTDASRDEEGSRRKAFTTQVSISLPLAQRRCTYCDARRRRSVHFVDAQRHPARFIKSDGVFTHTGGQHLRRRF